MSKQAFQNVEPIRPGYDWRTRIALPQAYWDAEGLTTGRLVAHVRASRPGALLAIADTGNGTIAREDPRTLVVTIGAADTLKLAGSSIAVFDFVAIDGAGGQRPLDGQWTWPVLPTVTRNIDGTLPAPDPLFTGRSGTLVATFEWASPAAIVDWAPAVVPGPRGQDAVTWRDDINGGEWLSGAAYHVRDGVFRDPSSFRAIVAHVAAVATEPGVGSDWRDVWRYVAKGGGAPEPPAVGTLDFSRPRNSGLLALLRRI